MGKYSHSHVTEPIGVHVGLNCLMSLSARIFLLGVTLLLAACTTLSEPEQRGEVELQMETAETQLDPAAEYEKAKKECAERGGELNTFLHGDGADSYSFYMDCWRREDPSLEDDDPKSKRLLPYDLVVSYSRETDEVIAFSRIYERTPEQAKLFDWDN